MLTAHFEGLQEQWVDGRPELRWRSTLGTTPAAGAEASSNALLEVEPGCALPRHVPHQVRSAGDARLRFVAVYAGTDVVTRYEDVVQPSGERELRADG